MLFLKSWLEEYVDLSGYSDSEISDFLSLRSGECESVETITEYFGGKVVVGRIENLRKHPEADRLNVFDVNIGNGSSVQIVSAAPNARDGLICPVALGGGKLPYMTIIPKKMRGIESQGMCCGMSELALETEFSDGLWELNDLVDELVLGKSICEALPQFFPTQTIFEVKYLQDKLASCANHLGLAYELAKIIQKPELLKGLGRVINNPNEFQKLIESRINNLPKSNKKITFEDRTNQTNFFTVLDLELENNFTLPHIYQTRLFLTGKNMIGGLADLSNYLLFDIGQPSHYFSSEKTTNLDWKIEKLSSETNFKGLGQLKDANLPTGLTIMTDGENKILTIPGVSGSEESKTNYDEKNILIEIANFPSEMVAITSSEINYRSDAAKYWASGVNPALTLVYILRLIESLPEDSKLSTALQWSNSEKSSLREVATKLTEGVKSAVAKDPLIEENRTSSEIFIQNLLTQTQVSFDLNYIANRLDNRGIYYWTPILEKKLRILGELNLAKGTEYNLTPNVFYNNINNQEDVLFELSKLVGIDNLEPEYLSFSADSKTQNYYHETGFLKLIFVDFGFSEVLTRPFLPENRLLSTFLESDKNALVALSSQRKDEPYLRDSLFSSLLSVANTNIKLGLKEPKIFELTKIYLHSDSKVNELSTSLDETKVWEHFELSGISCNSDPYILTSIVNKIQQKLSCNIVTKELNSKLGQGYEYCLQKESETIAKINLIQIKNSIKKNFDLPLNKTIWYIEIKFNPKLINFNQYSKFSDQSSFPTVERSYSVEVPSNSEWKNIKESLSDIKIQNTIITITPIERFTKNGKEILNYKVEFCSHNRTMIGEEIGAWEDTATQALIKLKK